MNTNRVAVLAAALAAPLLLAGCGGSSSASATDKWASSVCGSITTWQDSVRQTTDTLKDPASLNRSALDAALGDVKQATTTLADDLKSAGNPGTAAGQEAQSALDALASDLRSSASSIQTTIDGRGSGPTATLAAASTVTGTLAALGTQVGKTVDDLKGTGASGKNEVQQAVKDSPDCESLGKA